MLSHELRNPLASIRNSVYILTILTRKSGGSPQETRARQVIDRQSQQLTRLVDDLLDLTRIEKGKLRLQSAAVDLGELIERTAEDYESVFTSAGLALQVDLPEMPLVCEGDATRLSQVIGNLLGNAAKFTPRGGHAWLSLSCQPVPNNPGGGGSVAVIRVGDDGIGMSPEVLSAVFKPFMQADPTLDRSRGGLGLGLALSRSFVELHGGTLEARSEGPGRGSEFLVRLPLPASEPDRPAERRLPQPVGRRRRVLIIEDNDDSAESLKAALELDGHIVEVAYTGREGLEKARAFSPEVVLCDLGLPGLDGYAVARALHADPALRPNCLVALSGYGLPEDVERAREAGFDRHIVKPPDFVDLARLLASSSSCSSSPES